MAKISGSYASIARGVSQQAPDRRLDGQHQEQINMMSDPVAGLTRRRGTKWIADKRVTTQLASATDIEYIKGTRPYDFTHEMYGSYTLLHATTQRPTLGAFPTTQLPTLFFKGNATIPHTFGTVSIDPAAAVAINGMLDKGIKTVAKVGELFVLAVNNQLTSGYGDVDEWGGAANKSFGTFWIRGGAYSRKFTITVNIAGTEYSASYTTPSASYPGVLDTSDIPFEAVDYTKLVNDRVNAYNSAVTAWIGSAGADVQPPAIAYQLGTALAGLGSGAVVTVNGPDILVQHSDLRGMAGSDGGDSTMLLTTYLVVPEAGKAPARTLPGKILKVQPTDTSPVYYLKARGLAGSVAFGQVAWEESTGEANTPAVVFLYAALTTATTLLIVDNPTRLGELLPTRGWSFPTMNGRVVGDSDTSPAPHFIGRQIDYLGVFQDRLVVASGGVVNMSEVGNYLNFFRTSVLTVRDSDPIEIFAVGAETDTIRHSTIFDKSLVLFGDKQQYTIDGRIPVTPSTTTVIQSSAHEDATDVAPVTNGELVFFAKRRESLSSMYQIEIGDVQDTSRASAVDQQLADYLVGTPVQVLGTTAPNMVLLRTTGSYTSMFVFRYLDSGRQRILDSWSKWEYPAECGLLVGLSRFEDQVLMFFWREATGRVGVGGFISVDSQSLLTTQDDYPHLDSTRPYSELSSWGDKAWFNQPFLTAVVKTKGSAWLQGETPATKFSSQYDPDYKQALTRLIADYPTVVEADVVAGVQFSSSVSLTSPFRRDQNGVAVTTGRLVVGRIDVSYRNTSGMVVDVETPIGTTRALTFSGRIMGSASASYAVPVGTGSVPAFIGRESRGYTATIASRDWKPLTITAIEYTGQYFFNSRRA